MTLRVAIATSDHTLDQFVVVPVVTSLMRHVGKPRARVTAIANPRIRGDAEFYERLCEIVDRYGPVADIVIVVVDLDCEDGAGGRRDKVARFSNRLSSCNPHYVSKTVVVGAVNEAEVWALWGVRSEFSEDWATIRRECHPKERFFARVTSDELGPDKGRKRLIATSLSAGWPSLAGGCPELSALEESVLRLL